MVALSPKNLFDALKEVFHLDQIPVRNPIGSPLVVTSTGEVPGI